MCLHQKKQKKKTTSFTSLQRPLYMWILRLQGFSMLAAPSINKDASEQAFIHGFLENTQQKGENIVEKKSTHTLSCTLEDSELCDEQKPVVQASVQENKAPQATRERLTFQYLNLQATGVTAQWLEVRLMTYTYKILLQT